jgi:hypothetical protein
MALSFQVGNKNELKKYLEKKVFKTSKKVAGIFFITFQMSVSVVEIS